ncbi:MAG: DUF952 domain-containing protein [Bacteroidetes bacterium]|nr:DUF952 domain-containing protein [Bacteroidota bacterium]
MIYHVTTLQEWQSQGGKSEFIPADYFKEGFIHCCTSAQLSGVLERYFKGRPDLVLLYLDESKLKAELKYEVSTNDEKFPHLYGAIDREAIIKVDKL